MNTTKHFLMSFLYSVGQIGLGLLLHPYQTMQSLVQEKVFAWMSLFPTGVLAVVTLAWRWVIVPAVQYFFSCRETQLFLCDYLPVVGATVIFFCLYWQIMLIYLLFRFRAVFR